MSFRVFYSWQSDLPGATNRNFIQTALERAARSIRQDESIPDEPIIDRDTKDVPGSPDIGRTILAKIQRSQAFVCDVSIINLGSEFRETPNPNVVLELGYATSLLGDDLIVMVMNTAYGKPEQLPFDLRQKRVLTYHMPEQDSDRASERKVLQRKLEGALRLILRHFDAHEDGPSNDPLEEIEAFVDHRLSKIADGESHIADDSLPRLVLHLIPVESFIQERTIELSENEQTIDKLGVIYSEEHTFRPQWDRRYTADGVLHYSLFSDNTVRQCTHLFRNGIVEAVDTTLFLPDGGYVDKVPLIDGWSLVASLRDTVNRYLRGLDSLGVHPPLFGFVSILNAKGYYLDPGKRACQSRFQRAWRGAGGLGGLGSPIDRGILKMPRFRIDSLETNLENALKSVFDVLWNAVGQRDCEYYDEEGRLVLPPRL